MDLIIDLRKWEDGEPINHSWEAVVRAVLLLPSVLLLTGFWVRKGKIVTPGRWLLSILASGFLIASAWWFLFDSTFNILRGFPMFFNGGVDYNDGYLDKLLRKMEDWQEALLKIGLVMLSLWAYIKIREEKE